MAAKLSPGECAIEESVWAFSSLLRECSSPQIVQGKPHDKPFQVSIHQGIRFPTQSHTQELREPRSETPQPVQLTPHEDFARTVRQRIHDILQQSHMQEIHKTIVRQGHGETAAEILTPEQPDTLLEAMDSLYRAVASCLATLQTQFPHNQKTLQKSLKEIVGWQALLTMNREQLQAQKLVFDPRRQGGLKQDIPLRLEAGLEVLVSSLGDRAADFVLKVDNQQRPRVVGKHSLQADELEHGLVHTDQLTGVLQCIWSEVMKPEPPPTTFGVDEKGRLRARIQTNERREQSYYYIAVPPDSAHALLTDRVLLEKLRSVFFPAPLRIMHLIGPGSAGLLLIDEYLFNAAIVDFLRLLEDQDNETGATP